MKTPMILLLTAFFPLFLQAQENQESEISMLLEQWHQAAANNDQDKYFEMIDDNGIYIGTDSTEIWTRQEFYDWSTPYFAEEKGWSFTTNSRNIYFAPTGGIAWFDELLNIGKGTLRGSGVLIKRENGWRIIHYVLSVPIPNERYREVINVIGTKSILSKDPEE